jgi:N-acetylmuramoyl-L-alanine amidase
MPGDERPNSPNPQHRPQPQENDGQPPTPLPASVIFMEMMRQQAASRQTIAEEEASAPPDAITPQATITAAGLRPAEEADEPDPALRRRAALEAQRNRRAQRRRERRRRQAVSVFGGIIRTLIIALVSAVLMATILSLWTSPDAIDEQLRREIGGVIPTLAPAAIGAAPTRQPTPNYLITIGVVSGHRGPQNDPGAVCPDGLTENEINYSVASRVVEELHRQGYVADLLDEFDPRLQDYRASALISIHANTCQDFGELVTGYMVAQQEARPEGGEDSRLRECVAQHYGAASGLDRRLNLTHDMTDYYVFRAIHPQTPGVILELGFMLADRDLLVNRPDAMAEGVLNGILCFIRPDMPPTAEPSAPTPEATPTAGVP